MARPARLVVIGGSDAGISAALRAREVAPATAVTVVVADAFPNYSICGLPFYLSGETPDWRSLAHRARDELEGAGLRLLLERAARAIDPAGQTVTVVDATGAAEALPYDRLVVATGAAPARPAIPGLDLPGVHVLHTMADSFRLHRHLTGAAEESSGLHPQLRGATPRSAVIVGSGYIGLEMADALTHRGLRVTLLGRAPAPLPTVDPELGRLVAAELRRRGVEVLDRQPVRAITGEGGRLTVRGPRGLRREADLVLVAAGVRPAAGLAAAAGVRTGVEGAIRVDRAMATNVPDVFAAGDCAETWHRVLGRPVYLPLGTTAHKQGRVAGENAVGGRGQFAGSLGTQVVKVFDLAIARTGLREEEARAAGFDPVTAEATAWDHTPYYPGARELRLRVTGDRRSGRLLGAQILGDWRAEVAKRIDVYAAALYHSMRVEEVGDLDLSYTPPLSGPWDPVQLAAQAWSRA